MYCPFRILHPFSWAVAWPFLAWLGLFLAHFLINDRKVSKGENATGTETIRPALLRASVLYGAWLVASVELLSLGSHLNRATLAASWLILLTFLAGFLRVAGPFDYRCALARLKSKAMGRPRGDIVFAFVLLVWLGALLAIALMAAPGNHDSMTYRLPRVMQWIQNGSIQFFPTHILRQNHLAPFAEWNLLNLRLLAGNDQLFNLVQWFCYCGGCVAASLIARLLGAGRAGQWFAVAFVACTPMAVLQSTSTQNDLVAGFFLLCFIYFGLLMSNGSRRSRERWLDSIFCGLSLGLGLLTKSTIYLFAFPFSLYIACRLFHCCRWRMFFHGGLIAVCVALILTGHTVRNFRSYHHLLGPLGELCGDTITFKYQNDRMDAGRFCYSLLRNIGLHGNIDGVPNFRYAIQTGIQSAAHWLGVPEDDPATTWLGTTFELSDKRHEDLSGNFPQVVIFSLACALLLFQRRDSGTRIIYGLCIIAGGFLFALVLRWQPWHARLHTPLFMAMAPFCGSVFGAWRARGLAAIPACILVYYAVPFLVMNNARPLFGKANVFQTKREKQYFISNSSLARPYKNAVALLKSEHCKNVGLQTDLNDFQYPFWVLAERAGIPDTRFIQVNVANISKTLGAKIIPDAVIATSMPPGGNMSVGGVQYHCALQDVGISVYLKNR